jgi:hypothetical protein
MPKFSDLATFLGPMMIAAIKAMDATVDPNETKAQKVVDYAAAAIPMVNTIAGHPVINTDAAQTALTEGVQTASDAKVTIKQANDLFVEAMKLLSTIKTVPVAQPSAPTPGA